MAFIVGIEIERVSQFDINNILKTIDFLQKVQLYKNTLIIYLVLTVKQYLWYVVCSKIIGLSLCIASRYDEANNN